MQADVRRILERLEVRDRRSHSGNSSRRRRDSNGKSEANIERSRRLGNRDDRWRGIENIKLKIPPFTRSSMLKEYLDWVPRVEKVFDCYEWDERMKVKITSLTFTKYASLWWDKLQAERCKADEENLLS